MFYSVISVAILRASYQVLPARYNSLFTDLHVSLGLPTSSLLRSQYVPWNNSALEKIPTVDPALEPGDSLSAGNDVTMSLVFEKINSLDKKYIRILKNYLLSH